MTLIADYLSAAAQRKSLRPRMRRHTFLLNAAFGKHITGPATRLLGQKRSIRASAVRSRLTQSTFHSLFDDH